MREPGERSETARAGEEAVARRLEAEGCRILERNLRIGRGEIDIVADDHGVVAVVEVKTRRGSAMGMPHEAVTEAKKMQLRRLGRMLATRHRGRRLRFDVAGVTLGRAGAAGIVYWKNAFTMTG
jgi:putative endonuclease